MSKATIDALAAGGFAPEPGAAPGRQGLTALVKQRLFTPEQAHQIAGAFGVRLGARFAWWWKRRHGDFSLRIVEALVRRGDTVVDIGANWGLYAASLARLVGPGGRVHVFEPHPNNQGNLRALRDRCANLALYALALSDREGAADLYAPTFGRRRISALASLSAPRETGAVPHEAITVAVARLDTVLADAGSIGLIKCDVEGHELAVLRGAEGVLRRSQPALIVEIEQRHPDADVQATFDYLLGLGYAGYAVHADGLRPLAEFDVERDQLAFLGEDFIPYGVDQGYVYDFLFVRPGTDVARLLAPR